MNDHFVAREICPSCGFDEGLEICRASYSESPLREYLVSFYSSQGGVEFEYLRNQDYILIECENCELIYQKEIPDDLLMGKLYEEWIDPTKALEIFEKNKTIEYFSDISSEIIKIVSYFDLPPNDLHFLDFSMGWGNWCRMAQAFGCRVHGTEFSAARVEHAKRTGIEVVDLDEISEFEYDFINTEQVFEHLPNPLHTLSQLKDSMKKNSILKISVPNGWNVKENLEKWNWNAPKGTADSLNAVAPLEHVNCFNFNALIRFARNEKLIPIDISKKISNSEGKYMSKIERIRDSLKPYYRRMRKVIGSSPGPPPNTNVMFRLQS